MKTLKNLVVMFGLLAFLTGCSTGGRGGNYSGSNLSGTGGLVLAGGVIVGALIAHAFTSAKNAEVKEKAIEAVVLLESPCKVGPGGKVTYNSAKEAKDADLENSDKTFSAADCERLIRARASQPVVVQAPPQRTYQGPYDHYLR